MSSPAAAAAAAVELADDEKRATSLHTEEKDENAEITLEMMKPDRFKRNIYYQVAPRRILDEGGVIYFHFNSSHKA